MITPYGAAAATPPIRVLVLYYSSYGHIEAMASAEAEGAKQAGVDVVVKRVPELVPEEIARKSGYKLDQAAAIATVPELADYDAIIIGTPTRFGNMAAQMKSFLDRTGGLWGAGQAGRQDRQRLRVERQPAWRPGVDDPVGSRRAAASRHGDRRPPLHLQGPAADGRDHRQLALRRLDAGRGRQWRRPPAERERAERCQVSGPARCGGRPGDGTGPSATASRA